MKLIVDQNLSPRLVSQLNDIFPESTHVSFVSLDKASDSELWSYAGINDYIIVTKDADFSDLSMIYGHPPKIIWIGVGNCSTETAYALLRNHFKEIQEFYNNDELGVLSLL